MPDGFEIGSRRSIDGCRRLWGSGGDIYYWQEGQGDVVVTWRSCSTRDGKLDVGDFEPDRRDQIRGDRNRPTVGNNVLLLIPPGWIPSPLFLATLYPYTASCVIMCDNQGQPSPFVVVFSMLFRNVPTPPGGDNDSEHLREVG